MVKPLTAEEVLQLWERGEGLRPVDRSLALLSCARRGLPSAALETMTVGESEVALLELRAVTFGGDLVAVDHCPDCRTPVELSVNPAVLIQMGPRSRTVSVNADGWEVEFRVPTIGDLAVLARETDAGRVRLRLLERCACRIQTPEGKPGDPAALPPALQARVAAAMDAADPTADLRMTLDCAACQRVWDANLDVATFLWREISAMARRLLRDVDELASRYGWSESSILGLSAVRRQAYLTRRWA
jgi:hypothetical protein